MRRKAIRRMHTYVAQASGVITKRRVAEYERWSASQALKFAEKTSLLMSPFSKDEMRQER